jgi:hypothetical protein
MHETHSARDRTARIVPGSVLQNEEEENVPTFGTFRPYFSKDWTREPEYK